MEAFLSTLPPYVHEFLNQYPPTDVFNLLKELICFAVLYSDDRARINEATNEFLEKKKLLTTLEKADGSVLESTSARSHETIEEEEEEAEGKVKIDQETKKLDLQQNDERKQKTASLPSTFPDWWGHHEEELLPSQIRKEIKVANNNHSREIKKQQSVDLGWVSCKPPYNNATIS
ncbi:hypothetical protein BDF20DRAFT_815097 [Mycotypha africana]|uniref:uncharacterized protein n=1 Tax=Mycotypha africana TaxID=64632 RepID=UPI0023018202|nr:uncharacterized protein BDF20DRAFT_815097 [Mycotypha africana]KAI8987974.1 hypothetical protein BDF20DRAFT_815097 [Mycotypha africana]